MDVSQAISVSGMLASQRQLDVVANNLANANSTGFRRAHATTTDLGYQAGLTAPVGPGGAPLRIEGVGEGARVADVRADFVPGNLQPTGGPLDVALAGDGFLSVTLPDGQTGYTRAGAFALDADGRLVNENGLPVRSDAGGALRVPAGATGAALDEAGRLVVADANGAQQVVGTLAVSTFRNNLGLQANGGGVWLATAASGPATAVAAAGPGAPTLVPGALEGSNVDVADEFTRLIQAQRSYQLNGRVVQAWDEIEHMANALRQ